MADAAHKIITVDFGTQTTEAVAPAFLSLVKDEQTEWWRFLLRWVDAADVLLDDKGTVVLSDDAYDLMRDMLVNRPAELGVMLPLVNAALARFRKEQFHLTGKQEQALILAEQAAKHGQNAATWVANSMNVSKSAAYKLLQRARERKMSNSGDNLHRVYRQVKQDITERDIKRKIVGYRCSCPGKGWNDDCERVIYGDRGLCWPCYNRYGFEGERREWLEFLIQDNRRNARAWAIESLTTVQVEDDAEFDALLRAA